MVTKSRTKPGVRAAVRAAVIAYGAAASLPALALGLGEIEMQSFLNEPLRAEVELLDTRQLTTDDIRIRLAGGDDFDRLGVERSYFLTSIKFDIVVDERSGRGVIKLSTDEAVLEPFIDLIIEARWPNGRLLREYTVLVDPPAFRQDVVTVSASERIAEDTNLEKPALAPESRPPESSGTERRDDSLAVRESNLPAGEMPQRAFSAETATAPRSGSRYMVKRDETLWQIASEGKPSGISVQQAMLEIQRLNPEAFINGNINRIKAGYIIYLPAAGEVSSDDLARALDEVREQNQAWREGQGAPGVTAAATLRVSADSSVDTPARSSDASLATDAGPSSQGEPASAPASTTEALAETPEGAAPAGESAGSAELAAQLDAMASRLDTLEQIVSLKDEQIATLEQALREAREAAAAAAAAPAPQVTAPPTASAPQAAPRTAPQAPPSPAASGGIPWLPISGGLLAIAAAVVLLLRRRAAGKDDASGSAAVAAQVDDDDVFEGVNLKSESFDADDAPVIDDAAAAMAAAAAAEDDSEAAIESEEEHSRGGSRGYGERKHDDYIDEGAAGDALAEADIYIAYGRYLQAIELLETAISIDPGNGLYHVKLIELYVDMGEEEKAAEQLETLRENGSPDTIARGEALVGGGASAAATAPGFDLETPADDEAPALDLTDDLDLEPEVDGEAESVDVPDSLELSLEDADASDASLAGAQEDDDFDSIEFEHLEIEEDTPLEAGSDELDFAAADEELDLSDALVSAEESMGVADASAADSADSEDLLIAEDADQMATKLDLARAYLDMGDSEGARGILEEVMEKGTEEQQQESRDLLTRIG
ncbi:FimV N-terminal domain protein [Congregibacter litoralis KT71]|uniref:FimV N-terminal domain protein n=2 Tax=Congregibacter TaxID=393661 RepID=V7HVP5_9GAMM|nr:FimV N-terminal domain protein [Congregibacter litoralis KT71]